MAIDEMLKNISDRIGSVATVNTAFGEARVLDHRALIPVALVMGGFGGGGGEGKMAAGEDGQPQEGSGGGGGGGFAIRPLAVLEVTDQQTRIIPILDLTKIILASLGLIGGTLFMFARRKSKR
ncbi:MAG TPA: spore germination protein GerW family protein [Armatimonadota bacterium]|nr:spore germination protein GerW family protein [Armatimonadota bacterium]